MNMVTQVIEVLANLSELCSLYAKGNPFLSETRHFRKRAIAMLPKLAYMDDRPVFPRERSCAEAW